MNARQFTLPLAGERCAVLTIPLPLESDSFLALEDGLDAALDALRREVCGDCGDAGAIEYASWVPRPLHARG